MRQRIPAPTCGSCGWHWQDQLASSQTQRPFEYVDAAIERLIQQAVSATRGVETSMTRFLGLELARCRWNLHVTYGNAEFPAAASAPLIAMSVWFGAPHQGLVAIVQSREMSQNASERIIAEKTCLLGCRSQTLLELTIG